MTQTHFHGEFATVFPAGIKIPAGAHGAIGRVFIESFPQSYMAIQETHWNQFLYFFFNQFLSSVTKHPFCSRIYQYNTAGFISQQDPLCSILEQGSHMRFFMGKILLHLFQVKNYHYGKHHYKQGIDLREEGPGNIIVIFFKINDKSGHNNHTYYTGCQR